MPAYTHLPDPILYACPQHDQRWSVNFMALLDSYTNIRLGQDVVLQQVCTKKGGTVPGCRVFTHPVCLEKESCREIIPGVARVSAEEVDERWKTLRRQGGKTLEIEFAPLKRIQRAKRDNHCRGAGRYHLDWSRIVDLLGQQAECRG